MQVRGVGGNTALHYLMQTFSSDPPQCTFLIELLISGGLDPNTKNDSGNTPLHIAVIAEETQAILFAVEHNALAKHWVPKFEFCTPGEGGKTLLHIACDLNLGTMVVFLLKNLVLHQQKSLHVLDE